MWKDFNYVQFYHASNTTFPSPSPTTTLKGNHVNRNKINNYITTKPLDKSWYNKSNSTYKKNMWKGNIM